MKKILVIEDDQIMRENISELLELDGYNVSVAKNGKEGVEKAQSLLPDLIVSDIKMPILDGYGVLRILQKDEKTAGIPFIFLTAKTEKKDLRKGMEMGADDFLAKPFEDTELLNAVETRLRKSERVHQNSDSSEKGNKSLKNIAQLFDQLRQLDNSQIQLYKAKEIVYKNDAYPHYIYFVESGQVKTFRLNQDGKEFITDICNNNNFFGYQAIIENRAYQETAQALEDSKILKIPKDKFTSLVVENKNIAQEFIKMISKDLTETEVELSHMAYDSVRKRVGIKLLEMVKSNQDHQISLSISRTDLASMVGTTTETIVRIISELKELKLIKVDHQEIILIDQDKFKDYLKHW